MINRTGQDSRKIFKLNKMRLVFRHYSNLSFFLVLKVDYFIEKPK